MQVFDNGCSSSDPRFFQICIQNGEIWVDVQGTTSELTAFFPGAKIAASTPPGADRGYGHGNWDFIAVSTSGTTGTRQVVEYAHLGQWN